MHASDLHAFGKASPPSLGVLGELRVLGVAGVGPRLLHPSSNLLAFVKGYPLSPPLVVLAAFGVDDCDFFFSGNVFNCSLKRIFVKFSL